MNYEAMDRAELELQLKRLKSSLEDLEEMINFNLTYAGDHIGGGEIRRDEERLRELKEEIRRVEELLSRKDPG